MLDYLRTREQEAEIGELTWIVAQFSACEAVPQPQGGDAALSRAASSDGSVTSNAT